MKVMKSYVGCPCTLLAHQTLLGIRTKVGDTWWDRVHMRQSATVILCVYWAHERLVACGHGPSHFKRQLECGCFIVMPPPHLTLANNQRLP